MDQRIQLKGQEHSANDGATKAGTPDRAVL